MSSGEWPGHSSPGERARVVSLAMDQEGIADGSKVLLVCGCERESCSRRSGEVVN